MIINTTQIKQLKDIPNSGYDSIKVEFLFHSNKLEGSTFSKENLELYLKSQIVEGSHKIDDIYETINSTELFDFVIDTLCEPLTSRLLLEFHQLLKKNTTDQKRGFAGTWEKIPNIILGTESELQLAQPHEVSSKIEQLLQQYNISNRQFTDIVFFHANFEKIHPFQDGNGRIGRFVMLKQCIECEVDLISIDAMYSIEYKKALFKAQTKNDYNDLNDILKKCQKQLNEKLSYIQNTIDLLN